MGVKQQMSDGIPNQNSVELSCFPTPTLDVTLSPVARYSVQLTCTKGHFSGFISV